MYTYYTWFILILYVHIIYNIISTYFNMVVLSEVPIFALALGRVAGVSWPGVFGANSW